MEVANPIYDSVFKYLLEDDRVAKVIIGALTGFDVVSLELRQTEYSTKLEDISNLTVYRLDFAARIKTAEGTKLVLIEIQKAKFPTDIMRFRRYLGEQYSNPNNVEFIEDKFGRKRKVADPIFSIYFLGHKLETTQAPVIKIKRTCSDVSTGEELTAKEEFIESLTHDSVIVQIPELREKRRNKLEMLLSIFDQQLIVDQSGHVLNIDEESFPKEFGFIIKRLLLANSESDIRKKMTLEDEIVSQLEENERLIAELGERAERAIKETLEARERQKEADAKRKDAEAKRKDADAKRKDAETKRKDAEAKRKDAEAKRKDAEAKRKDAEAKRKAAEAKRKAAEAKKENAVKILAEKLGISLEDAEKLID